MTTVGGETHSYDVADRHVSTVKGSTTVSYSRDVTDRIIQRVASGETTVRYNYLGSGDAADFVTTTGGALVEASSTLPDGVLLTWRTGSGSVWSYPNIGGTVAAVANQSGVKQGGTFGYDPDGNTLGTPVDNAADKLDYGWHGEAQRPVETAAGLLPMIEMGARQYLPDLGRFIEVDPVEGGNPNDYSYVIDPIDGSDLDGMCGWTDPWVCVKKVARKAKDIAKSVGRFVKKHRDTIAFGLALILACVGCMAASAGLRVWSTYDACRARQKVSCAVGVASLATFGAAKLRGSAGEALGKAGAARLGASRWHLIRRHVTDPLFASVGGAMKTGGKWLGRASNVGGAYSVCSGYGRCPA